MRKPAVSLLIASMLVFLQPAFAAGETGQECKDFKLDVSKELMLFAGKPASLTAAVTPSAAPVVEAGKLQRLLLGAQGDAKFVLPPGKTTDAAGTFAGIVKLSSAKSSVRVSLDEAAWIDVIVDGKMLESTRHAGSHDCKILRKTVEFSVKPGATLLIQVSGSRRQAIRFAVTYP